MGKKEKIISAIILVLFVAIIVVLAVGLSGLGKSEPLPAAQGGAGQASETRSKKRSPLRSFRTASGTWASS